HPDPIHVTAHFLYSPSATSFEGHIRLVKKGKNFTNMEADLVQDNITKISSHLIFGVLELPPTNFNYISVLPPSPYARRLPLYHHPATAPRASFPSLMKFHSRLDLSFKPEIVARNEPGSLHRTNAETVGGGGVETGFWRGFSKHRSEEDNRKHQGGPEVLSVSNLPLFCRSWFPTMTMSIENKFAIPKSSKRTTTIHSNCTVGVFSSTNFLHGTMGRHSLYTELWTAPCHIGEDVRVNKGWRDDQVCLAVSMQMVLVVPMERNLTKGKEKGKL
ncbi:hypothetical protein J3R30DRAFT_3294119, partial [Lentinula aciculospora]